MAPQDSFIDDDEDSCPLCVEEFDLSDKNFRPCPCGYQICQFCFNNIRSNMNGLCPACRRPYDDKTIEWKVVTPEEIAQFKANAQKNAKKRQEQRQKEAQKREVESLNRKHLSGLRVVQKNLVYVVGLSPGIPEQEILSTLRGEKYFGQYGKIIKIVVSNKKQGDGGPNGQSLGVYVTFARKEDAARCIAAVNGSQNGERILRAQLGTTKYCSAYLRNETCTNKNCMFLHEPGDNDDSYSRQDLSSINIVNTQRPLSSVASSSRQAQVPIPHVQPVAAATQPMVRDNSKDGSESGDGSALPSAATWATRGLQQRSRRGSLATSGAASSPAVSQVMPAPYETAEEPQEPVQQQEPVPEPANTVSAPPTTDFVEAPRPERDPVLIDLLKAINSPNLVFEGSVTVDATDAQVSFPPLFDDRGGEKRRAMREHQEEARLHLEQDSQEDLQSVAEPLEEEEPESGSLQLGGEPEDNGRDGILQSFHNQRRPSTQMPIQRTSNSGPFGPSLSQSFPQNIGSLPSINGRTLTPHQQQQLLMLKASQPQNGFLEQYPPGMGGQGSALFQQQGHNRQSSRYSFANDTSATTSVKPAANPKLMAQQSSMMPNQQGNQFYGSSIPGPPPGLKSSGTPPIGSGAFGQSHGFGNSMGAFGGLQKDSNSELLRDMLRGRGAVGGGQSHDSKREYLFPSFLHQYPSTSSTPAPASGPLASLYGPQTGAFQDFGHKQKKKGKKHRHANTSSSGGGGLVDLADPSILQARMQHQQQSNAGVGQGLFGGQAQDDSEDPSLDDTTFVDALVADSTTEDFLPRVLDNFSSMRMGTPSVPPGFDLPHAHPTPLQEPVVKPASRIVPTSAPFTPSRKPSALFAQPSTSVDAPQANSAPVILSTLQAKEHVKASATTTGLSATIASQASHPTLQSEDFPALDSPKPKPTAATAPTKSVATPGGVSSKKPATIVQPVSKVSEKRATPNLNISVPSKVALKPPPDTPTKQAPAASAFPPLPTSTTPAIQSPLARNMPKTLRLTSTPKAEAPAAGSATPSSVTSALPPHFPTSRQSSLAKLDRPSTPTSEIISDGASITSASISRTNSPPPSKIGSAPIRTTTKSSVKKLRQAQKEKDRAEIEAAAKVEPEVEIAPIMGRKKKQKKERTIHSAAGGSTPAASRPASPGPSGSVIEESKVAPVTEQNIEPVEQTRLEQARLEQTRLESEPNKPNKLVDIKGKGKAKAQVQQPTMPEPPSATTEVEDEAAEKPLPTPASIFQDIVAKMKADINDLSLLKNPSSTYRHLETPVEWTSLNQKLTITPEDRATLLAGKPVHKIGEGGQRIMLTPNGDCVRNLTPDEEQRYLQLQASLARSAGPTAFVSTKHSGNSGFTLIGGRAVPNGRPSFFPTSIKGAAPLDPVSKIQRDEALNYINQYVLPSLSSNTQLEKALNANALEGEMLRSSSDGTAAWTSWGTDPTAPGVDNADLYINGTVNREGMIATGLENMTAQFAIGGDIGRGQPLGNVNMLSVNEAESAMQMARKEADGLEKRLNALIKKNRRLLMGAGH